MVCVLDGAAVIDLLFPSGYAAESGEALAWLAPAPLLFAVALMGTAQLLALQRNRAMLLAASVALTINLVLNFVLIPTYGATGAAAATTAAYAVQAVVVLLVLRSSMPHPKIVTSLLPALVASLPLAAILLALHAPVLIELVLGAVVYLVTWVLVVRRLAPHHLAVMTRLLSRKVGR